MEYINKRIRLDKKPIVGGIVHCDVTYAYHRSTVTYSGPWEVTELCVSEFLPVWYGEMINTLGHQILITGYE